ncbi:MAG: NAD-dependent epimerase/dehydratase family protein [Acidobacteria bacterium]|nr:NAD-dependent epimerase/dehydratase family protein [Acidobacteriota bacterium]
MNAYAGRTILVTGGRGYVGAALTQALAGVPCVLILLDRSPRDAWRPAPGRAEVAIRTGDVAEREAWDGALAGVDWVFHLAGTEYDRRADADPLADWRSNALPIVHLLEACRRGGHRPRIVFTSSVNVVGSAGALPVNEDRREAPLIAWSAHKLLAEHYLRIYTQRHGIASRVLRLSNVYGPTPRAAAQTRAALNRMAADAIAGRPVRLYRNAGCLRDYVFIDDVVEALLAAGSSADAWDGRPYIVGSGVATTIADAAGVIARAVRERTGVPVQVQRDPGASGSMDAFEMRSFVADIARLQAATGWTPRVPFDRGVAATVDALLASQPAGDLS